MDKATLPVVHQQENASSCMATYIRTLSIDLGEAGVLCKYMIVLTNCNGEVINCNLCFNKKFSNFINILMKQIAPKFTHPVPLSIYITEFSKNKVARDIVYT